MNKLIKLGVFTMNFLNLRKPVSLFIFVFFAVALFYSPVFLHTFGYHNDYRVFDYSNRDCCFGYPETKHLLAIGRPILAVLLNIQLMFVSDMQSLQFMHVFSVITISVAASLFFLHITNILYINRYSAAVLSVLTFTLPSMSINSFWVANFVSEIVPLFIVLFAHHLISKPNNNSGLIIVAVFSLIFISLLIYPPATLFFVTLTFIKFLYGEKFSQLSNIFAETTILICACTVYFLGIKYIFKPFLLNSNLGGFDFQAYYKFIDSSYSIYSFSIFSNLAQKIDQCQDLLVMVFSAWFPPLNGYWIGLLVFGFFIILTNAASSSQYLNNIRITWKASTGLAISIFLVCLTALPVLAGPSDFEINYRVIFASMAIIPATIVFVLDRSLLVRRYEAIRVAGFVTLSIFIVAALTASVYRLVLVVNRASAEYNHVLEAVSFDVFEESNVIRIAPTPTIISPLYANYLYRDFNLIAMNITLSGIVKAASRDIHRNLDAYSIVTDLLGPRYNANISEGITFNRDGEPRFIKSYMGISGREAWGRWTDGEEAVIEFAQPLPAKFTLKIKAGTSSALVGRPVKIIVGNSKLEAIFNSQEATEVGLNVTTDGNATSIVLEFPNIKSPMELGLSADTRRLGLALIKLQINSQD